MTPTELLVELENQGGAMYLEGDQIKVRAPDPLSEEMMTSLRYWKPAFVSALSSCGPKLREAAEASPATLAAVLAYLRSEPDQTEPRAACSCGSVKFWKDRSGSWHCEACRPLESGQWQKLLSLQ